ncbi:hypothetical protein [Vibrio sp. YQ_10]|uniref:hypothetical protein n=1 Tax=Vibrio sp. YQ_10 TaxID=3367232 RepID=UPI00370C582A
MTQNIEQRTLAATATMEGAAKAVDEIANTDKDVSTPVGSRKSFPKISREWDEKATELKKTWENDSATLRQDWQNERNELSTKALGVKPWESGVSESNINQQRRWDDGHTYLPKTVPAVMDAGGPNDDWVPYTADKSDTLKDVFGQKPVVLTVGAVLVPDAENQYPKVQALGQTWELKNNSTQLTVSSFSISGSSLAITLDDDSVVMASKLASASREFVTDETRFHAQAALSTKQLKLKKGQLQGSKIAGEGSLYLSDESNREQDESRMLIGLGTDEQTAVEIVDDVIKFDNEMAAKAIKPTDYKVINIDAYGCRGDYYLFKLSTISNAIGSAFESVVNPNKTDNAPILNKLFSDIDSNIPVRIKAGIGDYFCSATLELDYQVNNFWKEKKGIGRAYFRGEGIGSTAFIFPENVDSGLEANKSNGITNVNIGGFSLRRLGFDAHIYQARPTEEDFDFSGEPRFGCGLYVNHNGYIGDVSDIYIDGFYCSFKNERAYNAKSSRIFNTNNAIYGYLGDNNTTVRQSDCNFKGYQAGWASNGGSNTLSNVVVEGVISPMELDPTLMDKFRGHGFWQTGGRCTMLGGCYTEKLTGYARAMVGTTYHEIGGICSNGLGWHYHNDMSQALKDKVDIYNPDLICIYIVSGTSRTISKLESSYLRITDAIYVDDKNISRDKAHTNIFEIINTLPTSAGFNNTLDNVFLKHRPAVLSLPSAFDNAQPVKYDAPTIFRGTCKSLFEYSSNYNGYARFGFGRLLNQDSWYQRAEMLWGMDAGGNAYAYIINFDDADTETSSVLALKHYATGALGVGGNIVPITDAVGDCGRPGQRFEDAYFVNTPITGSDVRIKNSIMSIPQALLDFALTVEIKQYKLFSGTSDRFHYGVIIDEAFLNGLAGVTNIDECAAFCHSVFLDEKDQPIELDVFGVKLGDVWQVRYTEWQNILLEAMRRKLIV